MIVIVDTNIIISACLNYQSELFSIIISNASKLEFVTSTYALDEIKEHRGLILSKTKVKPDRFDLNLELLLEQIFVIDDREITNDQLREAEIFSKEINVDDTLFIALAIAMGGLLWTGDKKLYKGVRKIGFINIINTDDLKSIIKGL